MNIKLMKAVDELIGRFLTRLICSPAESVCPSVPESILVIRPGGIGDAVLLAPAINHLRSKFPSADISILAESRNSGVFDLIPAVNHLYCYDKPAEFIQVLRGRYDLVIDTEQWHRLSAVVARLVRAPSKTGFDTNERRRMFSHTMPYSHDDYEAYSFLSLLEPLTDVSGYSLSYPFLNLNVNNEQYVDMLLKSLEGKKFITVFPGASIPERRWGADKFNFVASELSKLGYSIVVIGGKENREEGEYIAGSFGLNLAGRTSLAETASVIARSLLLLSGDSGLLHIAVGLGMPTVSVFGPGRALKWAPQGVRHKVLNQKLECSPCTTFGTTPSCPDNVRCMKQISPEQVIDAVKEIISINRD